MKYKEALDILGLPPFISKNDIKNRYKELAKEYHPDKNQDSEMMHKINSAYELLMDYIENYKYSFDDQEISKQRPDLTHNSKFKF